MNWHYRLKFKDNLVTAEIVNGSLVQSSQTYYNKTLAEAVAEAISDNQQLLRDGDVYVR